jgi:hypothetical protein
MTTSDKLRLHAKMLSLLPFVPQEVITDLQDAASTWDSDKELLAIAGRLIDGMQEQINSYLRLLEDVDVD